jgi:CheY-like chemotaxis protein
MDFEITEVFTQAARRGIAQLHEKKLACTFDCRGPRVIVHGDDRNLRCALHRLICGMADLLKVGFVIIQAQTQMTRAGRCAVDVRIAGAGMLAERALSDTVLERLQLSDERMDDGRDPPRLRRASGICPATGAQVRFASMPGEGALISVDWMYEVEDVIDPDAADAAQARAWVIHDDNVASQSLIRRLQRLGWATTLFESPAAAARRLCAIPTGQSRPALVVAMESEAVSPISVQMMRPSLPDWTTCWYGVIAGSPSLALRAGIPGFETRVWPFSPGELLDLTQAVACHADRGSGHTRPMPATLRTRPTVLVADTDDHSRLATCSVLEVLGCEGLWVLDNAELPAHCRRLSPAAVFVDLCTGGMDGLAATLELRELERTGGCVPAVVIGIFDGNDDALRRAALEAGMDAVVDKPLSPTHLRTELQRTGVLAQTEAG